MRKIDEIVEINNMKEVIFLSKKHKKLTLEYINKKEKAVYPFVIVFLKVTTLLARTSNGDVYQDSVEYTIARVYESIWEYKRLEEKKVRTEWEKKNDFEPGESEFKISIKDYVERNESWSNT